MKRTEPNNQSEKNRAIFEAGLVYKSEKMGAVIEEANMFAHEKEPLLLTGETGSGKEVIAKYMHQKSRGDEHFTSVDCAALNKNLLESELFGHNKGSFTGANNTKKGFFSVAGRGTIYLDEIAEMNPEIQAKLLKVIETGLFRKIGSTVDETTNSRIIASTNKGSEMVGTGGMRKDLWYRFDNIHVPPLRERIPDIIPISMKYLDGYPVETIELSPGAQKKLLSHKYPGNVRELQRLLRKSCFRAGYNSHYQMDKPLLIEEDHIIFDPYSLFVQNGGNGDGSIDPMVFKSKIFSRALDQTAILVEALVNEDFNYAAVARALCIDRRTLYYQLNRHYGTTDKKELRSIFDRNY